MLLKIAAFLLIISGIAFLMGLRPAHAEPAPLSWTVPTSNVDGSPLVDLAAYRVYADGLPVLTITAGTLTAAPDLAPGTHSLTVASINAAGVEGPQTNSVVVTVTAAPPMATAGPYGYEQTGTATSPTMSAIGLVQAGAPCGPVTKVIGVTKFCQIAITQIDTVIWPTDRTLAKGVWAKAK